MCSPAANDFRFRRRSTAKRICPGHGYSPIPFGYIRNAHQQYSGHVTQCRLEGNNAISVSMTTAVEPVHAPDAGYIFRDRDQAPQAIVNVYLLDRSTSAPMTQTELEQWIRVRLPAIAEFRRRLVRLPFELAGPYWIEEPDVQPSDHVFVHTVESPGSEGLIDTISSIADERLDLSGPPWQVHLLHGITAIQGVANPVSALVVKIHHSVCDGVRSAAIGRTLLSAPPDPDVPPVAAPAVAPSVLGAVRALPTRWRAYTQTRATLAKLADEIDDAGRSGRIHMPDRFRPRTRFNAPPSGERHIGIVRFDMDRIQRIRQLVRGATVNDVALATVSGALDAFLKEIGEAPAGSLAAMAPRSVRGLHDCDYANKVIPMIVDLHTDVTDPVARLSSIHESAAHEKIRTEFPQNLQSLDCLSAIPAFIARMGARVERRSPGAESDVALANTVVSNYIYETGHLALRGAPVIAVSCVPLLDDDMLLGHMIATAGDVMTLTISADSRALPDPSRYTDLLRESFEHLSALARSVNTAAQ